MNDLLSAIANTSKQINDVVIEEKKEKADAALREQEADLWKWTNEFFDGLNYRTDTENFKQEFDFHMDEFERTYGKKYRSNYQQKMGNEILNKYRLESEVQLKKIIKARDRALTTTMDLNTAEEYKSGNPTQENLNKETNIYTGLARDNRISKDEELQRKQAALNERTLQAAQGEVDKWFDDIVKNPEVTESEFIAGLTSIEIPHLYTMMDNTSLKVDEEAAKQTMKAYGLQKLNDFKEENNKIIFDTNTSIISDCKNGTKDELQLRAEVEGQIAYIKNLTELQINEDDYRSRLLELENLKKIFDEEPSKERSDRIKIEANKSELKLDPETFINAALHGDKASGPYKGYSNLYLAKTAYMEEMLKYSGKPANQLGIEELTPFFNKAKTLFKKQDNVVGLLNQVEKLTNKYASDPKYEKLYADMLDYTWDLIFETDMSNFDAVALEKQINKKLEIVVATELKDKKISIEKIGNKGFFGKGGYNLNKAISDLEENDYAYTDIYGRTKVTEEAVEVVNEKVIPEMAKALFAIGGIDSNVDIITTSENMYDVDLNPQFKDKAGNVYKFKSSDDGYIILKNGKEYTTEAKVNEQWDDIDNQRKEEINVKVDELKKKQKGLANELKDRKQDNRAIITELAKEPDLPIAGWKSMSPKEKAEALQELRATNNAKYQEIVKQYNLGE